MSDGIAQHLDPLKKSARNLRKAYASGDPEALSRVAAHVRAGKALKHSDFLHVIACEAGHESWPKLKFAYESAAMSREQRAERLKVALYFGQHWITQRLLGDDPDLKDANLGLQVALYDLPSVQAAVEEDPEAATRAIGVRSPLLHLAFSRELHRSPWKSDDMLAIAKLLVANGADVNDGYPPDPGFDHKISALYGALCHADNFELGKWLLAQGADPNDDESLYHSTALDQTRALELLLEYGANPDGTNALPRALDFENDEAVRLLLEAGANPNVTVPDHPSGMPMDSIPSLHQAIRRGRSASVIQLLMKHGADPDTAWMGHTAYATARIYGNRECAGYLDAQGHASSLSDNERVFAACADGSDKPGRFRAGELNEEDRSLLNRIASEPGRLPHLQALVSAGLDPDITDSMGMSPLHLAGWNGLVPEMAYFLSLGPDLTRKNAYGGDALDTVLHGSEFAPKRLEADHIACARLLLEAGSVLYPKFITGCGNEEMVCFLESWRDGN